MVENKEANINFCVKPTEKELVIKIATNNSMRLSEFVRGIVLKQVQCNRNLKEKFEADCMSYDLP